MQRFKILHRTYYNFPVAVKLQSHALLLRPKEGHELRIESSSLEFTPPATVRWHRDVDDNSVAIARFGSVMTNQLMIESEVIIQQFNVAPLDFLVADYAMVYPFYYRPADKAVLLPYMNLNALGATGVLADWVKALWSNTEVIQTYTLLQRLIDRIQASLSYNIREEPGVQTAEDTLTRGTGSCRDYANLFMEAARLLGFASRFVSGYLHSAPSSANFGATHAWAEVFLPGAGWKGFDPTSGEIVGPSHIPVAVSRLPESVPPISGSYIGPPGASLDVGVWVSEL